MYSCSNNCYCFVYQSDIFSSKFLERKSFRLISLFEAFDKLRSKKYHFCCCLYTITITSTNLSEMCFCSNMKGIPIVCFVLFTRVCLHQLLVQLNNCNKCIKIHILHQIEDCFNKFETIWSNLNENPINLLQFVAILFNLLNIE